MTLETLNAPAARRTRLGREILQLTNKSGPLTSIERQHLQELSREIEMAEDDVRSDAERKYDAAFRSYLRNDLAPSQFGPGVSREHRAILEARDMGVGASGAAFPGSTSGFFVSMQFNDMVTSALKSYTGVISTATLVSTDNAAPRAYPSDNDATISGEMLGETVQATASH